MQRHNPYYVSPTAGFNGFHGLSEAIIYGKEKQQHAEAMQAQSEQEAQRQVHLKELVNRARRGDMNAVTDLYAEYPELGAKIEASLYKDAEIATQEQKDAYKGQTSQFLQRYFATPPEGRQAYLEEVSQDPNFAAVTADDELLSASPEQQDMIARLMAPTFLSKEQLNVLGRGKPESGRFQYKETPTGFLKVDTAGQETAQHIAIGSKQAKLAADEAKAVFEADVAAEEETFKRAEKIRGRYDNLSSDFRKVRDAYNRITATEPTAQGDLALIFNFMKMLDPGSVVREGEFATAQNTTGVPERTLNMYNRVVSGERLNPKQRKRFVQQAESLFKKAGETNAGLRQETLDIGNRYGLSEVDLFGSEQQAEVSTPATETVDWSDM